MKGYRIAWPILDDSLTLTQLVAEATAQIPDRCAEQLLLPAGPAEWSTCEGWQVDGWAHSPHLLLVAELLVVPLPDRLAATARVRALVRARHQIAA